MLALLVGFVTALEEKVELPLFGKIDEDNAGHYYDSLQDGQHLLWFSFDPENVNQHAELHGNVLKEAAQVNPEYKFVWYDTAALEDHAIEGLGCAQFPCLSLVKLGDEENDEEEVVYTRSIEAISPENIASFLQDVKDKKIEPYVPDYEEFDDEDYDDYEGFEDEDDEQEEVPEM